MSTLDTGSSKKKTSQSNTIARAKAHFCNSPAYNVYAVLFFKSLMFSI